MADLIVLEKQVPTEDILQVEIGVKVDGFPLDSPLCRELGLLLVAHGREEDVIQRIREVVGLPEEFQVHIALAEPTLVEEKPVVLDPPDLSDLTIRAQDCVECSAYSWSKGCSSWPW